MGDYMNPTAGGNMGGPAASTKSQILTESPSGKKQDFLEASPYWDQATVPANTWKNKSPYTAKVVSCKRIVGPEATGETCHIIFDHKGQMSSLCVRRATYWDPEMGKEDPAKKGVCSNYLCDSKPGDDCKMTGPSGKVMLMPEENSKTDYIM